MQKWQKLAFLIKVEIEETLPESDNIDSTSSDLQKVSSTLDCPSPNAVEVSPETRGEMDEMLILRDKLSNTSVRGGCWVPDLHSHPRKMNGG